LVVVIVFVWPVRLEAEVIHLKNGDKVVGKVVKRDERILVVDVGGVTLNISLAEVLEVEGEKKEPAPTPTPVAPSLFQPPSMIDEPSETLRVAPPAVSGQVSAASFPELPLLPVVLPPGRTYRVTGSAVRFRDGPGLDYEVVDTLIRGTLLTSVEEVNNWTHARTFDGLEGWMDKKYLEPMANVPVVAVADRVNLRDGPGQAYRSVQRLRRGDVLILLDEQGTWWRVQSLNLKVGWCNSEYLLKVASLDVIRPRLVEADVDTVKISYSASSAGAAKTVKLTTINNDFVVRGLTNVLALHREEATLVRDGAVWSGPDLLKTDVLTDQAALARAGFDKSLVRKYKGANLLLIRGRKEAGAWTYTFQGPPTESIDYALVIQQGKNRGAVVRARP
jgi:SH3-like domain-containing protein